MEVIAFGIGGIFAIAMLVFGIMLTVITMIRIHSGALKLPTWGKFLICTAMIAMLVIQIASLLPPEVIRVDNPFENEYITPVPSVGYETTQNTP